MDGAELQRRSRVAYRTEVGCTCRRPPNRTVSGVSTRADDVSRMGLCVGVLLPHVAQSIRDCRRTQLFRIRNCRYWLRRRRVRRWHGLPLSAQDVSAGPSRLAEIFREGERSIRGSFVTVLELTTRRLITEPEQII